MNKKQVNKQQALRIKKIEASYYKSASNENAATKDGLVLSRFGRHALVEDEQGQLWPCSIRSHIKSLVAGDRVVWQIIAEKQGIVLSCYPRQSSLERLDNYGKCRAVAANLSQLLIVIAVKPELSWSLLDSYLVLAHHLGLKACIVLNKSDLACQPLREELEQTYQALDYEIICTSTIRAENLLALTAKLNQETSVFVGQSGVGKSSLIAALLPEAQDIAINTLSLSSELGRHTTSNSRLYHLPSGGNLIDSPGVREFNLQFSANELINADPEFKELKNQCKFRNCDHEHSPDCALIKAVAKQQCSPRRYDNLLKLLKQSPSATSPRV